MGQVRVPELAERIQTVYAKDSISRAEFFAAYSQSNDAK
jgi:hypothetical protein